MTNESSPQDQLVEGALAAGDTGDTFYISRSEFLGLFRAYVAETGKDEVHLRALEEASA